MGCEVTFHLKKKTITYKSNYDSENDITLDNVVKELLSRDIVEFAINGKWLEGSSDDFMVALQSAIAKKDTKSHELFVKNLKNLVEGKLEGSLVGNYTLKDLTLKYPSLNFEQLEDVLDASEEIIYLPGLKYDGLGLGGTLSLNGRTYHILSNYYDVKSFLYNLNIRKRLKDIKEDSESLNSYLKDHPNLLKAIDFIKNKLNISKNTTAIEYFFKNSDKFLYAFYDGVDIYSTISNYLENLVYDKILRKQLADPLANSIYQRASLNSKFLYILTMNDIKNICKVVNDETSNSILETIKYYDSEEKKINTKLPDANKVIAKIRKDGALKLEGIISELFEKEGIYLSDIRISNGLLYFLKPFISFEDVGFSQKELNLGVKKDISRFGLNCFEFKVNGKSVYYVSTGNILTLNSSANNRFDSFAEASAYIDTRLRKQSIFRQFLFEKYTSLYLKEEDKKNLHSSIGRLKYFNPGKHTSFDIYDYYIPNTSPWYKLITEEYSKYLNYGIEEAIKLLGVKLNQDLTNVILDYDKFVILLLELSKGKTALEAITTVNQLKFKRYFVVDKTETGEYCRLKLAEVTPGITAKEDNSTPQIPTITYLNNLADLINKKYRLNNKVDKDIILIITNEDLTPDMPKNVKGFIRDGVININASKAGLDDLVHEFSHLFLGMLKATNLDSYVKLLEKASKNERMIFLMEKLKNNDAYKNLPEIDIAEEAFVSLFGKYILHSTAKLNILENEINREMSAAIEKFKTNLDSAVTLSDLFLNFNTTLFSSLSMGNGLELLPKAARQRQATNLFLLKLEKQEITEGNCD